MKCTDIKSSHLKSLITIQRGLAAVNEFGVEEISWSNLRLTRGAIKTSSFKKKEFMQTQGISSLDIKDLIIRFCEVSHQDRVVHEGKQYKIVNIENLEESNKYLILTLESLSG